MPHNAQTLVDQLEEITTWISSSTLPNRSSRQRLARTFDVLAWFLLPEVRQRVQHWIREDYPQCSAAGDFHLPSATGACAVPVTWRHRFATAAAPAGVLPLRWAATSPPEGSIPDALLQFSHVVRDALAKSHALKERAGGSMKLDQWHLNWTVDAWSNWQLGDLAVSPESAFAPLAIGLICAALNITPAVDFIATGQWDLEKNRWAVKPATLESKLKAAFALGFRRFVVPPTEKSLAEDIFRELEEDSGEQSQWLSLPTPQTKTDLGAALLPILPMAGSQPSMHDRLEDRATWYDSLVSHDQARVYFESHILPDISHRGRRQIAAVDSCILNPDSLLSIYSGSEDLLWLTAVTWTPRRLVYLCTEDFAPRCVHFVQRLMDRWQDVVARCRHNSSIDDQEQRWAISVAAGEPSSDPPEIVIKKVAKDSTCLTQLATLRASCPVPSGRSCVIDATPGRRAMQIALTASTEPGDVIFCWWHSTSQATRRPVPLDLEPNLWVVEQDRRLRQLNPPSAVTKSSLCLDTNFPVYHPFEP
ncbi:MAG: hypothetical protein KatS3mg105_5145 [Gemmatales bacterium]|nr:MAG: hypothetical protein KatS3mg105_5145 [Gemmatales bacterium]GIW97844.1 MAG: hypothetical protein KatS3mg111_1177 [Pirellulaceae bacterium]